MNKHEYMYNNVGGSTKLILPIRVFENMRRCEQTFGQFRKFIDEYISVRRTFCGTNRNTNVYIEYNGELFSVGAYGGDTFYFHLWADDGLISVVEKTASPQEVPTKEWIAEVIGLLDEYMDGYIRCSDCGNKIKQEEVAGRFFAGSYCTECWRRKWKAVADAETYD